MATDRGPASPNTYRIAVPIWLLVYTGVPVPASMASSFLVTKAKPAEVPNEADGVAELSDPCPEVADEPPPHLGVVSMGEP